MRHKVASPGAPAAIGPYSQAVEVDGFLFCSGQLGMDPSSSQLLEGIDAQSEQALANLDAVLTAAGLSFADVVKTTVFLSDLANFAALNAVYERHVVDPAPARSSLPAAAAPPVRG